MRFDGAQRLWMLAQMGLARAAMRSAHGVRFWKLLGTGHGLGFSLRPNFGVYAVLAVWDHGVHGEAFLHQARWMRAARNRASEVWSAFLLPASAQGSWNGRKPFEPSFHPAGGPIAVLTRATIRPGKLAAFWSAVPGTSAALEDRPGLLLSTGIGEMPLARQATFSIWRDEHAIRSFAYHAPAHAEAVLRTHGDDWYAEEMFVRFAPLRWEGTWGGRDPLAQASDNLRP
jgi:hypothetical protein